MFNNIKRIVILFGATVMVAMTSTSFAYQLPAKNNFWQQTHLQTDGRGGYYDHKPGTSLGEDQHITPDNHWGFYVHKPGTFLWEDNHISSDGRGGFYY
jgi:hypothetical protein